MHQTRMSVPRLNGRPSTRKHVYHFSWALLTQKTPNIHFYGTAFVKLCSTYEIYKSIIMWHKFNEGRFAFVYRCINNDRNEQQKQEEGREEHIGSTSSSRTWEWTWRNLKSWKRHKCTAQTCLYSPRITILAAMTACIKPSNRCITSICLTLGYLTCSWCSVDLCSWNCWIIKCCKGYSICLSQEHVTLFKK